MRFQIPRPEQLPDDAFRWAYMAGLEGIPVRSVNRMSGSTLIVDRDIDESGNLFIPWRVAGRDPLVLSTASLMERDEPYLLPVEIARGTLNRLRHQIHAWRSAERELDADLQTTADRAMQLFIVAATTQRDMDRAAELAGEAIDLAVATLEGVMTLTAADAIERRHQRETRLPTMMAVNVGCTELTAAETQGVLSAFNSAAVPVVWRRAEPNAGEFDWQTLDAQIEWCREVGLRVCGGPILRLDKGFLPDWLYLWEDDFEQIEACVASFVEAVVTRYHGKMHAWHCAARLNTDAALALEEEDMIRLAATVIQTARHADSKTPLIVSFDQPWGEYLAREDRDLSPLHFADALVRADLGIAGLGVEINLGYSPGGTLRREMLDLSQQLDRWLYFGLPLLVMLTIPSSRRPDEQAARQAWPIDADQEVGSDEEARRYADYLERVAQMLLAKTGVHGVIWDQLHDATKHEFAHGGLFDEQHQPKAALSKLIELRRRHLV
ncbi:MAG: endo-1,4-beta-xylanase [Planctomycetales bacterium]|nr:endo-1,4-beta-xylanase [Planctomycetales bacterium]